MEVAQIASFVNAVREDAFGKNEGVEVRDTTGLVSLGKLVFSSDKNTDIFWSALTDRIGRTTLAIRAYTARRRSARRDPLEWGVYLQKINYTTGDVVDDGAWLKGNVDPMNVDGSITPSASLFKAMGVWERDQFIPDIQLKSAFLSFEAMAAFISGLFTAMDNALELELERVTAMAVNTHMAQTIKSGSAVLARNLLAEYNAMVTDAEKLTTKTCFRSKDWLKFASREIKLASDNMTMYMTLFNVNKAEKHTPKDLQVLEVLADFSSSAEMYLESDTFHEELVKLPMYESVSYWQGVGNDLSFDNKSKINITYEDSDGNEQTVEQGGIIAYLHDYEAVAASVYDIRTKSIYNPKKEVTNYFKKANTGFACDPSENGVVFYIEDEPA